MNRRFGSVVDWIGLILTFVDVHGIETKVYLPKVQNAATMLILTRLEVWGCWSKVVDASPKFGKSFSDQMSDQRGTGD